jgi:hypothetical protein
MSGHHPWPPPNNRSNAYNLEWDYSPYASISPENEGSCSCNSRLCVDCSPTEQIKQGRVTHYDSDQALLDSFDNRLDNGSGSAENPTSQAVTASIADNFWLTWYRLKAWIKRLTR